MVAVLIASAPNLHFNRLLAGHADFQPGLRKVEKLRRDEFLSTVFQIEAHAMRAGYCAGTASLFRHGCHGEAAIFLDGARA